MFEPGAPKLHLNLSNLPIIICSATSEGGFVNMCAMFCKYRSSNCWMRMSINADPIGFPETVSALLIAENGAEPTFSP